MSKVQPRPHQGVPGALTGGVGHVLPFVGFSILFIRSSVYSSRDVNAEISSHLDSQRALNRGSSKVRQHRGSESAAKQEGVGPDFNRRNHCDVTGKVFIADPRAVCAEICSVLSRRFPDINLRPVHVAFRTFADLYVGELPGYLGCETWYHDAQHSLDCALAMSRLIDGYESTASSADRLGERRAVLGVITALFHDAGYIRKTGDKERHGAEFTLYHVRRSGDFLSELLPRLDLGGEAPLIEQLVHFTGYEVSLDNIQVQHPLDRRLGFLLGTADLLSQMSDRCYLEKCYQCLYAEFEVAGLAGKVRPGVPEPAYSSPEDLIRQSPGFLNHVWRERLDGYFEGTYRHLADHFHGPDPYLKAIKKWSDRIEAVAEQVEIRDSLRRDAYCINAGPLRLILGLKPRAILPFENGWPPAPRFSD